MTAPAERSFVHTALVHDGLDDLLSYLVPFVEEGQRLGDPVLVRVEPRDLPDVREALAAADVDLDGLHAATRPSVALRRFGEHIERLTDGGANTIRILSYVPHPGVGAYWDEWVRYETAVNHLLDDAPVWGVCAYDRRTTPVETLVDVERTHPLLATSSATRPNGRYEDPFEVWASLPAAPNDPLQAGPARELVDPTTADVRAHVAEAAAAAGLSRAGTDDLVLATNEIVTNAFVHGAPPVEVRLWHDTRRVVVTVTDRGAGLHAPFTGLEVDRGDPFTTRGRGLWIAHQLAHVAHLDHGGGHTVRLATAPPGR